MSQLNPSQIEHSFMHLNDNYETNQKRLGNCVPEPDQLSARLFYYV